ncbi:MAG: hypothetical protein IH945_03795 [Armatimonadetes bacterium]|nr:hypothetical protein [Armatimonadota bacterium]
MKEEDLKYSLIDRATDIFDQIMGGVSAEERPWENRRTGRHTVDALDARFLETVVEIAGLMEAVENNDRSARALLEGLSRPLDEKFDWSYEIASTAFAGTTWIDAHLRSEFHDRATLAMFELLDRFPDHEGLPDELPPDLQFPDPFGGEPAHYVKTATGFLIYTIGSAYDDTRYTPSHPDLLGSEARFTTGLVHGQWAYILSYDPIIPVP